MKVQSEQKGINAYVREYGKLKINGITFTVGEGGKALAYDVDEADVAKFCGVKGYTFYHDNGDYAGVSDSYRAKVSNLVSTSDIADPEALVRALVESGQLTPEMLARARGDLVGAPEVAQGTLVDKNGFPLTTSGITSESAITLPSSPKAEPEAPKNGFPLTTSGTTSESASPNAEPEAPKNADQGEEGTDGGKINFGDIEAVAGLKRGELMGAAKSLGVTYSVTESNAEIAQKVVEAFTAQQAAQTEV